MLYRQIPQNVLSKIEKELNVNLSLLSMKFTEKQFDDNVYVQLSTVVEYLQKFLGVGSIYEPKEYFGGSIFMQWAEIYPGVIFFGGKINDIAVGLGGSINHVLGYSSVGVEQGTSHTPWLVNLLATEVQSLIKPNIPKFGGAEVEHRILHSTISWADTLSRRAIQKFDFIARNLKYSTYLNHRVLLGTPIYVAIDK